MNLPKCGPLLVVDPYPSPRIPALVVVLAVLSVLVGDVGRKREARPWRNENPRAIGGYDLGELRPAASCLSSFVVLLLLVHIPW